MKNIRPILYLLDASMAVTGAFIAARNEACAMKDILRIVLVLPQASSIPPSELTDFWRVKYLPIIRPSQILRYVPALLFASWRLRRLMQKDGAICVQLNDFYLMHGAVLRLLGYRGKIIQWVRCNPYNFAGKAARPLLWMARLSSNMLIAVSSFVQSLLPSSYNAEIIYDYYAGKTRTSSPAEKTFVFIGNYIAGKGQDIAIKAFAIVVQQDPSLRLAFYGSDMGLQKNRDYRKTLEASATTDKISFNDFVAEPFPVLVNAFAALNFSVSESFSMTVLEASGAGLPVIATASGGPQEIIEEGVTGYIIPVGDVAAAADKMLQLAKNPAQAEAMGQAGAERIKQRFSGGVFRQKLQQIIFSYTNV